MKITTKYKIEQLHHDRRFVARVRSANTAQYQDTKQKNSMSSSQLFDPRTQGA
jgi:hypothetical protein